MRKGIIGIYLAAGKSVRFGENKLSQQIGHNTLGSLALMTALKSKLDKIIVVTKKSDNLDWVSSEIFHLFQKKWFQVECSQSINGQAYSLKCGLGLANKLCAEAVIILLADQPFITHNMINTTIDRYKQMNTKGFPVSFIASSYLGISRPPILFHHSMFPQLFHLQGDQGARKLIQTGTQKGIAIHYSNPLLFYDVDTREDYLHIIHNQWY